MVESGYKTRKRIVTKDSLERVSKENFNLWVEFKKDMTLSKGKDKVKETLKTYKSAILAFFVWLADYKDNISFLKIDHKIMKEYLFFCQDELGNNGKIRNTKTSSISSLLNFCVREDMISANPLLNKLKRADISNEQVIDQPYPTEAEINSMRDAIEKIQDYEIRMIYTLFIELAISTACRVGEIVQFTEDNLDLESRLFCGVRGKGAKNKDYDFSFKAQELLKEWIQYKKDNNINCSAIFFIRDRKDKTKYKARTKNSLQKIAKKIGMFVGINTHAHSFRKAFATIARNEKNIDIDIIQEKLSHESSDTTKKFYIKKSNKKVRETLDKFEI